MSFVNAVIHSPADLDFRIALRLEFNTLGLAAILEVNHYPQLTLRSHKNDRN